MLRLLGGPSVNQGVLDRFILHPVFHPVMGSTLQ